MNKLYKDRFIRLWQKHSFSNEENKPYDVYEKLLEMYNEPWRHYHNLKHIKASLLYFDACKDEADFADAIELAIWFHDCIYVAGCADNEALSRDWFLEVSERHLVPAVRSTMDDLIMDTCHKTMPLSNDGKLIADIDLTSFGLSWEAYIQDHRAVQKEILSLKVEEPAALCKLRFLNKLIEDGQIYYSHYYNKHFEKKARENVKYHLELLANQ